MDFSALSAFLDSLPAKGIPGADMIVYRNHEPVFRHMVGWRDRENAVAMRGDELYYLYSVSKVFTCTAAMMLYEQGKFLMTDPVSEFIPAFREMRVSAMKPDGTYAPETPARNPITMRHLFTMTSGMDYDLDTPAIRAMLRETGGKAPTLKAVEAIAKKPLHFEPGTHFLYGLSHDVIAAVVEVISGKRFCDFVRENIFEPCGMKRSFFHLPEGMEGEMAAQYSHNEATGAVTKTALKNICILGEEYDSGGAGIISCVEDVIRLAEALSDGARSGLLSARTINLMRENHLDAAQMKDFDWIQFSGYGYGLGVRTLVSRAESGSPGPVGEFGWGGAAGAYMLIDPENRLTAYYGQHMLNSMEPYVHPRLRNLLYAALD